MEAKIDPAEVHQKIAELAKLDDTIPVVQQPSYWLRIRQEKIMPQLIAALDDPNPQVAKECMQILQLAPPSKELTEAMIAKAGDEKSPIRYSALVKLENNHSDARVAQLFDKASLDDKDFPNPLVRARWAWRSGNNERAIEILGILLTSNGESSEAIKLLSEINDPESVGLLETIASGDHWPEAAKAYLALAKINPRKYGLSKGPRDFLESLWFGKISSEGFDEYTKKLSQFNAKEVRPYVMQMLRGKSYVSEQALIILAAWKDKEALPHIRERLSHGLRQQAVASYLMIDNSEESRAVVLELLNAKNEFANESVLRGIGDAEMPVESKLAMLLAVKMKLGSARATLSIINMEKYKGRDIRLLLAPLMDQETNLYALALYCEFAAADKEKRFADQIGRAMRLLADDVSKWSESKSDDSIDSVTGSLILQATAEYNLNPLIPEVQKLLSSKNRKIRDIAQATAAKLGVPGTIDKLYDQLKSDDVRIRKQASSWLTGIKATNEIERAAREEAVLSCLGKPAEDYAMRLLATCGGEKTVKALMPILDDTSSERALYAAWVLAQLPDKKAVQAGLRRLAIYGMFHAMQPQIIFTIEYAFRLAPDLSFHQGIPQNFGEQPVEIPMDLLVPFLLDVGEQRFAMRCYQEGNDYRFPYGMILGYPFGFRLWKLDETYLPLLKEIAIHDMQVKLLMVKGQPVAHFADRQKAAQEISRLTNERATYIGLAGEKLDSNAFPQPYENQNQILAKLTIDMLQKKWVAAKSQSMGSGKKFELNMNDGSINELQRDFGGQFLDALRQDAKAQKIEIKEKR
jgi:hypothetical protein